MSTTPISRRRRMTALLVPAALITPSRLVKNPRKSASSTQFSFLRMIPTDSAPSVSASVSGEAAPSCAEYHTVAQDSVRRPAQTRDRGSGVLARCTPRVGPSRPARRAGASSAAGSARPPPPSSAPSCSAGRSTRPAHSPTPTTATSPEAGTQTSTTPASRGTTRCSCCRRQPAAQLARPLAAPLPRRALGRKRPRPRRCDGELHAVAGRHRPLHGRALSPRARVGASCVRPRRSNRTQKRCTRYLTLVGSFTHQGKAGQNFCASAAPGRPHAAPGPLPPGGDRDRCVGQDVGRNTQPVQDHAPLVGRRGLRLARRGLTWAAAASPTTAPASPARWSR